ncbi:MAG TPA: HDIG domain-containing protein, partial [Candidatus Cloacimonadota bacterium]|nr:HDIG domain-containing protein [Candidatus Cloacimonadota bacterium]
KIQSMLSDQTNSDNVNHVKLIISVIGSFLINLLVMLGFYLIMILYLPKHDFTKREMLLIWCGLILNAGMTLVFTKILSIHFLILPYSLSILLICIIFNTNLGLLYNFINFVVVAQYLNWQIFDPLIMTIATMGAVLSLKRIGDKQDYLDVGLYLLFSMILVNFAFSLYRTDPFMVVLKHFVYTLISVTLTIIGLILLVPWVERKLNIASKQILLELLDFNHPILKKLASNAMGTYHHSLIVGNLSESAAEAIGANPLLARVGSYYHDIGKISNPMIFTENNRDSDDFHDHLPPLESATKIRAHVNEGVALARKNKIPQVVIDIIQQHHGTSVIRYFLNKAEKEGLNIDLSKFQYAGPKPTSKEAALVMIADIVESTSKSMTEPSRDAIRKMIDDTILRLIRDGQLDDAPITIQELELVKKKMLPILESIYRKRLEYPEDKNETNR